MSGSESGSTAPSASRPGAPIGPGWTWRWTLPLTSPSRTTWSSVTGSQARLSPPVPRGRGASTRIAVPPTRWTSRKSLRRSSASRALRIARGPIADIEDLALGYYWCPDAVDSDPSYNGYLLNVFSRPATAGSPCTAFELFGGVTLNDVPSFGLDDGWDGSCLNRLDWFEDAIGMDGDGVTAGLVADDLDSIKSLTARCPAWVECFPLTARRRPRERDDILKAVKQFRVEAKRTKKAAVPDRVPLIQFLGARTAAAKTGGGTIAATDCISRGEDYGLLLP